MQCDKITEQFTDFSDSQLKLHGEQFRCFHSSTKDLDEFYFNDIDLQSFKELSFPVKREEVSVSIIQLLMLIFRKIS